MSGYTKLFSSILASTIWRSDDKTRIVWITLLAMADRRGIADGSVPGLADFARVTVPDCEHALAVLSSPDKHSRSKVAEGRRIEAVQGGWRLINYGYYREKLNEDERREYLKVKQREYRSRHRKVSTRRKQTSTNVNNVSDASTPLTQAAPAPSPTPQDQVHSASAHADSPTDLTVTQKALKEPGRRRWEKVKVEIGPTPESIVALWNELVTAPIPQVRLLTAGRRKKILDRLRTVPALEDWRAAIRWVNGQEWCRASGRGTHGSWVVDLNWLIRSDENLAKAVEGSAMPKVSDGPEYPLVWDCKVCHGHHLGPKEQEGQCLKDD